ncbi:Cu-oxidase-domain-containing protein [Lentinula edodes]|uniref:Cupredoxin n=1 Tax=Lentinula edodes TaxID=5353 RepID=UPI001E8CCDC6|nr:Cupredoxin [Lentinula edodes]KAH7873948.1 Cupredoxin [Lentinula edodes]KAJ3898822.1 Cu-oxidase-domain-containing protein [Lentinula edodes]KAJ3915020.1 Cu-oxidase-domain-containing protein [Lentinula edodes]
MKLLASTVLAVLLALPAFSDTIPITLDIVNADGAPDGFNRSMVTANGTYPGPLITATKGDTLVVTVNNLLDDPTMRRSTSLDFDGLFVNTPDSFNEGSSFVTTCPVAPNASYTYTIPLVDGQAGTFWYHSQLSVQYVDGLRGALVVYDPEDPLKDLYDVDDETTIWQVGDWWHNTTLPLLAGYVATGIVPVSDSGTFNGVGRFNGGPEVPFFVVNVVQGTRYRFRIINTSARNVFTMSIDSHNMTIIETDGTPTSPMTVNSIDMLAGQRHSVVVEANQPVANYWINAPYVGGDPTRNLNQNATLSRAILRYQGAPEEDPSSPMSLGPAGAELNALVEANLRPLVASPAPEADINITLNLVVTAGKAQWNVNNVSYLPPDVPTLVKILDGANSTEDFNVTENTFVLPANKIVQVIFPPSVDDEAHPFHLHGNNFWLIKSNSSDEINTENPIKRDVAGVGSTGTIMRFSTANPGPWFFHCHIFWHFQAGLATVMASGLDETRETVKPTQAWTDLCPAYDALPADLQ